jgi:hypothetical protein
VRRKVLSRQEVIESALRLSTRTSHSGARGTTSTSKASSPIKSLKFVDAKTLDAKAFKEHVNRISLSNADCMNAKPKYGSLAPKLSTDCQVSVAHFCNWMSL